MSPMGSQPREWAGCGSGPASVFELVLDGDSESEVPDFLRDVFPLDDGEVGSFELLLEGGDVSDDFFSGACSARGVCHKGSFRGLANIASTWDADNPVSSSRPLVMLAGARRLPAEDQAV